MRIILDRIDMDEQGKPVATFEVGEETVAFRSEQAPNGFFESLIPNAIVECEIVDGSIVNPVILHEETKQKEIDMKNRLHCLFKRNK